MSALTSFDAFVLSTRRCGALPLLLRAITAVATTGAIVATVVPSWDVPDLYVIVAALAALAGLVVPDSGAGAVAAVAIVVAWATGSPDGVGPAVVVTALCLLVAHVTAAQSAAMPVTAAGFDLARVAMGAPDRRAGRSHARRRARALAPRRMVAARLDRGRRRDARGRGRRRLAADGDGSAPSRSVRARLVGVRDAP